MQVAIIGTPGSGKTILTAVLSRYLSGHHDSVYMNPKAGIEYDGNTIKTISTNSYISRVLETLHEGQWPEGTKGNSKFELGFELHIGGSTYEMQLLDSAGEDLKRIGITYDKTELSAFQQKLFEYLMSSRIVIIIVNLDDFVDTQSISKRDDCENTLKEAVDNLAKTGVCHHILICFTAYDKYKASIDLPIMEYLRHKLPMFYRSCEAASKKVVLDYTEYDPCWKKGFGIDIVAVAPVIEQKPDPNVNSERYGKPPRGFDVRNTKHSEGMQRIADWLCKCEESNILWANIEEDINRLKQKSGTISYRVFPILAGVGTSVLAGLYLTATVALFINSLLFVIPIGAVIGFLVGDKLKVLIAKKDGLIFKIKRKKEDEEQEESVTSPPAGTSGTSAPPPRPSGTGGTSTTPPRPSGTGGAAASSGSESFD